MSVRSWAIRFGSWWMVQFALDGTLSFGLHVDPLVRHWGNDGLTYGPYLDLHLGPVVVSLGNHPARAGDVRWLTSVAIMRPEAER